MVSSCKQHSCSAHGPAQRKMFVTLCMAMHLLGLVLCDSADGNNHAVDLESHAMAMKLNRSGPLSRETSVANLQGSENEIEVRLAGGPDHGFTVENLGDGEFVVGSIEQGKAAADTDMTVGMKVIEINGKRADAGEDMETMLESLQRSKEDVVLILEKTADKQSHAINGSHDEQSIHLQNLSQHLLSPIQHGDGQAMWKELLSCESEVEEHDQDLQDRKLEKDTWKEPFIEAMLRQKNPEAILAEHVDAFKDDIHHLQLDLDYKTFVSTIKKYWNPECHDFKEDGVEAVEVEQNETAGMEPPTFSAYSSSPPQIDLKYFVGQNVGEEELQSAQDLMDENEINSLLQMLQWHKSAKNQKAAGPAIYNETKQPPFEEKKKVSPASAPHPWQLVMLGKKSSGILIVQVLRDELTAATWVHKFGDMSLDRKTDTISADLGPPMDPEEAAEHVGGEFNLPDALVEVNCHFFLKTYPIPHWKMIDGVWTKDSRIDVVPSIQCDPRKDSEYASMHDFEYGSKHSMRHSTAWAKSFQ